MIFSSVIMTALVGTAHGASASEEKNPHILEAKKIRQAVRGGAVRRGANAGETQRVVSLEDEKPSRCPPEMTFAQYKEVCKTGDIIFFRKKNWHGIKKAWVAVRSHISAYVAACEFSHVAIVIKEEGEDGKFDGVYIEASKSMEGVVINTLDHAEKNKNISGVLIRAYKGEAFDKVKVKEFINMYEGKPYRSQRSAKGCTKIMANPSQDTEDKIRRTLKDGALTFEDMETDWYNTEKGLICSELVAIFLAKMDLIRSYMSPFQRAKWYLPWHFLIGTQTDNGLPGLKNEHWKDLQSASAQNEDIEKFLENIPGTMDQSAGYSDYLTVLK